MSQTSYAVVLAGGQGTRFWPVSRLKRPKQFRSIVPGGESLIQATVRRIAGLVGRERVIVVGNETHRELVREHVPQADLLCEPIGRNTAASIALAAIEIESRDPRGIMVIVPADHAIGDEPTLLEALRQAQSLAAHRDCLVTIGVPPSSAHTGYGYIRRGREVEAGAFQVQRFYEKPSLERAIQYFESGEYFWNSGMFVWRVDVIMAAFQTLLPNLYEGIEALRKRWSDPAGRVTAIAEIFPKLESISIDFGVMEHARNCVVIGAAPFGWNDIGSWEAWANESKADAHGNYLLGDVVTVDSRNCVVQASDRCVAVLGAENLIVIDTGDALLVCPRERAQDVRKVVDELKARGRVDLV